MAAPRLYPVALKITRTPLAGGASVVTEETFRSARRRIRRLEAHLTQSIGNQGARLDFDNAGRAFDSWAGGDVVRIEAKRPRDATYSLVVEGYVDEPVDIGNPRPTQSIQVVGLLAVLDLVVLAADHAYDGEAWTDVYDDLATTYLTGYTRTITADASTCGYVLFPAGMKLREALDLIRRALLAETGDRWEHVVSKDGATKEIRLFPRDATVVRTVKLADLVQAPQRRRGSAFDVINSVDVYGATVPSQTIDKSGLARTDDYYLDGTTDRIAIPFTALDTPLYSHTVYAYRSVTKDPPSLVVQVQRNSDNHDVFTQTFLAQYAVLTRGTNVGTAADIAKWWDGDESGTTHSFTLAAGDTAYETTKNYMHFDLGAGLEKRLGVIVARTKTATSAANATLRIQGSNDDSAWTTVFESTYTNIDDSEHEDVNDTTKYRYWRLQWKNASGANNTVGFGTFQVIGTRQRSSTPTHPLRVHCRTDGTATTSNASRITTTGNSTQIMASFDFLATEYPGKLIVQHAEGSASSLLNLVWQGSHDDSVWDDLAIMASTTSVVTDTAFIHAGYRYFRLAVVDARAGGSAAIITGVDHVEAYLHIAAFVETGNAATTPLLGDSAKGSPWTWTVDNLIQTPGFLEEHTYAAPRLAVITGYGYWFVYAPQSGAATDKYWRIEYGTESGATDALKSTDSGTTWSAVAADAVFRHVTKFNNSQLHAAATDAASQAKYANLVPGGVLYAAMRDDALLTQEMVDKEAAALVAARGDVTETWILAVPYDPSVVPGKRVTVAQDLYPLLGTSGDKDVVEVTHDFQGGAVTVIVLGEHPPEDIAGATISLASERTA